MLNKKNLTILLIFLIIADFVFSIYKHSSIYTRPYNHAYFSEIYSSSQYILGSTAKRSIGDDGLYPFAGYYYVTGGDPSQVNFENPPLGKYLIGLGTFILGNENVLYLLYAAGALLVAYLIAQILFKNVLLSLTSVFLLEVSPFFKLQFIPTGTEQLSIALLDLPLMLFFTLGVLFFLSRPGKKNVFLSSFFLACAFATKFFPGLVLILAVFLIWQLKYGLKKIWLFSLNVIPVVYLLSYSAYFWYHPSFIEFLRYQKWIIDWRLGNPFVVGNIFRTILTGSYINWWDGGRVVDTEWTLYFAAIVVLGLVGGGIALIKKEKEAGLLGALSIVFIAYLGLNTVGVSRYVLLVYPLLTILAVRFFVWSFVIPMRRKLRPV